MGCYGAWHTIGMVLVWVCHRLAEVSVWITMGLGDVSSEIASPRREFGWGWAGVRRILVGCKLIMVAARKSAAPTLLLLGRYSREAEIIVGTPACCRRFCRCVVVGMPCVIGIQLGFGFVRVFPVCTVGTPACCRRFCRCVVL